MIMDASNYTAVHQIRSCPKMINLKTTASLLPSPLAVPPPPRSPRREAGQLQVVHVDWAGIRSQAIVGGKDDLVRLLSVDVSFASCVARREMEYCHRSPLYFVSQTRSVLRPHTPTHSLAFMDLQDPFRVRRRLLYPCRRLVLLHDRLRLRFSHHRGRSRRHYHHKAGSSCSYASHHRANSFACNAAFVAQIRLRLVRARRRQGAHRRLHLRRSSRCRRRNTPSPFPPPISPLPGLPPPLLKLSHQRAVSTPTAAVAFAPR